MKMLNNRSRGFTLIELLIVIVIIGILTGISVFALVGSRESARDARRKTDLEQIRSALELYRADCNRYPASLPASPSSLTGSTCTPANTNTYMQSMPADPSSGSYSYSRTSSTSYVLCSRLEDPPSPANNTSGCPPCTGGCGYKVTSP